MIKSSGGKREACITRVTRTRRSLAERNKIIDYLLAIVTPTRRHGSATVHIRRASLTTERLTTDDLMYRVEM